MKKITAILLVAIMVLSPIMTYANEQHNDDNQSSYSESDSSSSSSSSSESHSDVVITNTNTNTNDNYNHDGDDHTSNHEHGDGHDKDSDDNHVTPPTNHAPTIILIGSNPITISQNSTFVDPGATASDVEDGDLTSHIVVTGVVNTSVVGTYTLTYTVTDSAGSAVFVTRDVQVTADNSGTNTNTNFKIIATKIVCDNDSDLPNWGVGGPDVTANTVSAFLASHPLCHLESGWNFQWGYSNVTDPGNAFVGEAGSGWNTFGTTDANGVASTTISTSTNPSLVWVREVLKPGYAPFYGIYDGKTNIVSPGLYCHTDVLNFDNFDYVSNPQNNGTYYCVAINSKIKTNDGGNGGGPTNTPPSITLIGANPFLVATDAAFIDPGATATDLEDGDATTTSHIIVTGSVNASTTGTYTLTYSVTDSGGLSTSTTRTVVVNAATPVVPPTDTPTNNGGGSNGGGNGGNGGGGIGGHRHDVVIGGSVLGASTQCSYLRDYLRKDLNNDKVEVIKLQAFLNVFEKENITLDGVFGDSTLAAVNRFQDKYKSDILTPWGHTAPTGYVYILTKKKINEIYCNTVYPLSTADQNEITNFRNYLQSLKDGGANVDISNYVGLNADGSVKTSSKPTSTVGAMVGKAQDGMNSLASSTAGVLNNGGLKNLAISLLSMPQGLGHVSSTYLLIILAIVLIIAYAVKSGSDSKPDSIVVLGSIKKEEKGNEDLAGDTVSRGLITGNENDNDDDTNGSSSNNSSGTGFKGIIG